jgi:hypothetical protein
VPAATDAISFPMARPTVSGRARRRGGTFSRPLALPSAPGTGARGVTNQLMDALWRGAAWEPSGSALVTWLRLDEDDVEGARAVNALDPVQLDVAGGGRAADPGEWAAGVQPRQGLRDQAHDLLGPHHA